MFRLALVVLVAATLVACGKDKKTDQLEATNWCADELKKLVVPQLEKTFDGGDPVAFHAATDKFTQGTMCGPDFAAAVRDWEATLAEHDAAKAVAARKQIIARLDGLMKTGADNDWRNEREALAPLLEKAK
jgi:hypothetical protein